VWIRIVFGNAILFFVQAILLGLASAQTPATDHIPLAQPRKEPAPPIPQVSCPPGCLPVFEGRTAADVPIDYGIDGDLSQVAKAILEIKDDRGNLIFTTEVPVQRQGQFVWPKGVLLETTPKCFFPCPPHSSCGAPRAFCSRSKEGTLGPIRK
jgi:hypothetical protein